MKRWINAAYPITKAWKKVLVEVTDVPGGISMVAEEIGVNNATVWFWLHGKEKERRHRIHGVGYVNFCIVHHDELDKNGWKDPRPNATLHRFAKTIAEMASIYRKTGQMCESHIVRGRSIHGNCRTVFAVCQKCGRPLECGMVVKGKALMVGVKPCTNCVK